MKYLVTGSAGFIGKHLVNALLKSGNKVYGIDKKPTNIKHKNLKHSTKDLTKMSVFPKVDIVLHLAGHNGTRYFYEKPIEVVDDNLNSTLNLIKFYNKNKCNLFVYAGSPESIAGTTDYFKMPLPSKENYPIVIDDIKNPRWSYATSKALSELLVVNSKLNYCVIRYHNVYGSGQVEHFIPDFIKNYQTGKCVLKGYNNTRSFMYIDDAVDATLKIISNKKCRGEIINVGNNDEIKILDVAKKILKIIGEKKKLKLLPAPKGSVTRRCPDISKLKNIFKFTSKISLDEGLKNLLKADNNI